MNSNYDNLSTQEFIDIIEYKNKTIEELECKVEDLGVYEDEVSGLQNQIDEFNELESSREGISKVAFEAGHDAGYNKEYLNKSWLNYMIEARL